VSIRTSVPNRAYAVASITRVPAVRRLWLAQLLSGAGDWAARLALTVLVYEQSGSAAKAASIYALSTIPYLLAPAITRHTARWSNRDVMVVCDVARAIAFVAIAMQPPLWLLLTLTFLAALPSPVFEATRAATVPQLLPEDRIADGYVLQQATSQITATVGSLLGAVLLTVTHPRGALIVNACSFVASAILVSRITGTAAAPADEAALTPRESVRLILRTPAVRVAVWLSLTGAPSVMACEAVVAAYSRHVGSPHLAGLLAAAIAAVIAVGGIALDRSGSDAALLRRAGMVMIVSAGTAAALLATASTIGVAIAGYAAVGGISAVTPLLVTVVARNVAPQAMVSVVAVVQAALMTTNVAGATLGGLLASGVGVSRSCFIALIPAALYPIYRLLSALPSARVAPVEP